MRSAAHRWRLALGLAALLLTGCASLERDPHLLPGVSTESDVVARYGPPLRRWAEPDGGQTLEYSTQPLGTRCLMVRLDASGRWLGVEDTLRPESRARIQAGMTPQQVSRQLGQERSRVFFPLSGEDVWDWTVAPNTPGYGLRFNVHFKDGRVLRTTESLVSLDRRRGLMDD